MRRLFACRPRAACWSHFAIAVTATLGSWALLQGCLDLPLWVSCSCLFGLPAALVILCLITSVFQLVSVSSGKKEFRWHRG